MSPAEHGVLLKVGTEIYPVRGSDELGWSLDEGLRPSAATNIRYGTLEELFFVLVNLAVSPEGQA